MGRVAVIAPHPDDETLGCGGTLLRHVSEGDSIQWIVVTTMSEADGCTSTAISAREEETRQVAGLFGFESCNFLGFSPARLDVSPLGDIVERMKEALSAFKPETVYVPHRGDVHSDHRLVHEAAMASLKWFRRPEVRRILAYEVLSETGFGGPARSFEPNVYVDIGPFLERKIEAMRLFVSEMGEFPFPRSEKAARALAELRGAEAGFRAAEAFTLCRERI